MKILIVDDEKDVREYLRRLLEISGFEVVEADCGESALFALAKLSDVALVILDWMMPGMSGIDVLNQLKEQASELPILMLSARAGQEDILKALSLGATDYILKPINKDHLLFKINSLLRIQRESTRRHAARRKNVNFSAIADVIITEICAEMLVIESSYPIAPGHSFIITSSALAKALDIKSDTRYTLKSISCVQDERKHLIQAEFINLKPPIAHKIEEFIQK